MKIVFDSEQHKELLNRLKYRIQVSESAMGRRKEAFRQADNTYQVYRPVSEVDSQTYENQKNGKPGYKTLVVPFSYSILTSVHTYLTSIFLARSPIFQFRGRSGETKDAEEAVDTLIQYQVNAGGMRLPMWAWLLDSLRYGVGILHHWWDVDVKTVCQRKGQRTTKVMYEGGKVRNIPPYDFLPDPSVPIGNLQAGEYCGNKSSIGDDELKQMEFLGEISNTHLLEKHGKIAEAPMSGDSIYRVESGTYALYDRKGPWELIELYVRLCPKVWGLDNGVNPEIWLFTLCGNVILDASPFPMEHCKFPFSILEPDYDGRSLFTSSLLERLDPLEELQNWLVNSHMFQVRQSLHNNWIIDPSRVSIRDLTNGGPGVVLKLLPSGYGSNVNGAVSTFPAPNVTNQHINDTRMVQEFGQRLTGVSDNIMGMLGQGGRKTATEIRNANSMGIGRLQNLALLYSCSGFTTLAELLLMSSQQYMPEEMLLRVAGRSAGQTTATRVISPDHISGSFDMEPFDGSAPIDKMMQSKLYMELLQFMQSPILGPKYDWTQLFEMSAVLMGITNINSMRMMANDAIQQQLQAGNIVPSGDLPGQAGMPGTQSLLADGGIDPGAASPVANQMEGFGGF